MDTAIRHQLRHHLQEAYSHIQQARDIAEEAMAHGEPMEYAVVSSIQLAANQTRAAHADLTDLKGAQSGN